MKKCFTLYLIFASLIFTGCQTSPNEPNEVLSRFFSALYEKNFEEAAKYATDESKDILVLFEYGTRTNSEELEVFNPTNMQISPAIIQGDRATVPVKETTTSHRMMYTLLKKNGKWKVSFNTFPQMDIEAEPPVTTNPEEPVEEMMEEFKKVDVDSMKEAVKRELERNGQ